MAITNLARVLPLLLEYFRFGGKLDQFAQNITLSGQLALRLFVLLLNLIELSLVVSDFQIKVSQNFLFGALLVQLLGHILLNFWDIYRLELKNLMFDLRYLSLS